MQLNQAGPFPPPGPSYPSRRSPAGERGALGVKLSALYRVHAQLVKRMADTQADYQIAFRTVHDITQLIFEMEAR